MDAATMAEISKKLNEEEKRLEQDLADIGRRSGVGRISEPDFPSFGDKEDENAAEVALYGDNLSLEETLERELRDVKNAIKRIADGAYGICKYCKQEIALQRLLARPESSSCVTCKEKFSRG